MYIDKVLLYSVWGTTRPTVVGPVSTSTSNLYVTSLYTIYFLKPGPCHPVHTTRVYGH